MLPNHLREHEYQFILGVQYMCIRVMNYTSVGTLQLHKAQDQVT